MTLLRRVLTLAAIPLFTTMTGCSSSSPTGVIDEESEAVVAGTAVSFSGLYDQELTVSWGDASGGSGDLEYKLVTSTQLTDLDTVDEADALTGASVLMDWSSDTSVDLTTVTAGTYNYYAVIVRDEEGAKELYTPKGRIQGKVIYKTVAEYNGNLGGITGADAKCAASQPDGVDTTATVRAFIVDDGVREACDDATCANSIDWVLTPNWDYFNIDGDKIGTVAATGVFTAYSAAVYPTGTNWQDTAYTGLNGNYWDITATCNSWTSSSGADSVSGVGHTPEANSMQFTANANMGCDTIAPIICVEQ
ncbi:MAG TPA: DUF1554 domain-containing protein [Bdellovibrionales bacterium]|nr:DUF1554 domain-containing protein [Bdellovibrionales bacterium]